MHNPLVEFSAEGKFISAREVSGVDRSPHTEFYAGLLVIGFKEDYRAAFAEMMASSEQSLEVLLPRYTSDIQGVAVIISGIDYERLALTDRAKIIRII